MINRCVSVRSYHIKSYVYRFHTTTAPTTRMLLYSKRRFTTVFRGESPLNENENDIDIEIKSFSIFISFTVLYIIKRS